MSLDDASMEYRLLADQAGVQVGAEELTPEALLSRALQLVGIARDLVLSQFIDRSIDQLPHEPYTMLFEHPAIPAEGDREYIKTLGYNKSILGQIHKAQNRLAWAVYGKHIGDATYRLDDRIVDMEEYSAIPRFVFGRLMGVTVLKPEAFADYVHDLRTATDDNESIAKTRMSSVKTSPALADIIVRKSR